MFQESKSQKFLEKIVLETRTKLEICFERN
jgi:hypothetical protein